jgi:hypothetical protein
MLSNKQRYGISYFSHTSTSQLLLWGDTCCVGEWDLFFQGINIETGLFRISLLFDLENDRARFMKLIIGHDLDDPLSSQSGSYTTFEWDGADKREGQRRKLTDSDQDEKFKACIERNVNGRRFFEDAIYATKQFVSGLQTSQVMS